MDEMSLDKFRQAGMAIGAAQQQNPQHGMQQVEQPVSEHQLKKWRQKFDQYKSAKKMTEMRIISAENWWRVRNTHEERRNTEAGKDGGFTSQSAWLHNLIVSKHADFMEAYPCANVQPREQGDAGEAEALKSIIPVILDQSNFYNVYRDVQWQKAKYGTGVYKVIWDKDMHNGLGDIRIEPVNILNIYWEPGINDVQKSRYVFQAELVDKEVLIERYPELQDKLKGTADVVARFDQVEPDRRADKALVLDVYYHKGKALHYCKFCEDVVLYSTENDTQQPMGAMGMPAAPSMAESGLYDHGLYPYVFDTLYRVEGSPAGYGYVDIEKNPQERIDIMDTAILKNTVVSATPRFFSRTDGNVSEAELLDLSQPIVHVDGPVDEVSLRQITTQYIGANTINVLERTINELRETSGNTETSNGNVPGGVTAASAIAALQEASGKGSRDAIKSAYFAYKKVVELTIELIRQFYDLPRKFRILGEYGSQKYISYSNAGIKPQQQTDAFGNDMGLRRPVFDVDVSAEKETAYTKVAQNELALQLYQYGMFQPQMAGPALIALNMMDFSGKDDIIQAVNAQNVKEQMLMKYIGIVSQIAGANPELQQMLAADMQQLGIQAPAAAPAGGNGNAEQLSGNAGESGITANARAKAANAPMPK